MVGEAPRIDRFYLELGGKGKTLPAETVQALRSVRVEDDLAQPALFELIFSDPKLDLLDNKAFQTGTELRISAADQQGKPHLLLIGEITGLELMMDQQDRRLLVRGYDRLHRLHRGNRTRTFLRQTDGAIVEQIAREAGLKSSVDGGELIHEYVIQHNQTDLEFLRQRAAALGCRLTVDDQTLRLRKNDLMLPEAPAQEYGKTLLSFRADLSIAGQPGDLEVRAWDHLRKQKIVSRVSDPSQLPTADNQQTAGKAAAAALHTTAAIIVSDRPVDSQPDADKLAQALLDEVSGDYFTAEGVCVGEPRLRAGCRVNLRGVGGRFGGKLIVTATRHELSSSGAYSTTFYVSARHSPGLLPALAPLPPRRIIHGLVIGIVTNRDDPERLGRVRVTFPWLDDQHESHWARLATAGAGPGRVFAAPPAVGDEVLVGFEQGDINHPFVIGGLWSSAAPPPDALAADGHQKMLLQMAEGASLLVDATAKSMTLAYGRHRILLDESRNAIQIEAGKQTITVDGGGNIDVQATGDLTLQGAGGRLAITSSGVTLESQGPLTVQTPAMLSIQGSIVKINS